MAHTVHLRVRNGRMTSAWVRTSILLVAISALPGCTSIPTDLGQSSVDSMVSERGQAVDSITATEDVQELIRTLTAAPLDPDSATRIALLNNPDLKATYATLGFGAADLYEAGRIRNPVFGGEWLDSNVAGEADQVTLGLLVSFTDLITLPARKRLAATDFAALRQSIGAAVLSTAAEAQRAYYRYVGAQQVSLLRDQIATAAQLSAALAERFYDAGNITAGELALRRAAASEARLEALHAEQDRFEARAELANVLGLSAGAGWASRTELYLPVAEQDQLDTLITLAEQSRLDLAAARTRADGLADRLGVVNWTRWLGDLEVGGERERETDGARLSGPTVDWEVPIFNQHRDAVLRADAELKIAVVEVQRLTTEVDNDVRVAFAALDNARTRVDEYRDVLIPARMDAVARAQEEVNFMLIGVFELISIKQEEYDAYQGYLEAIRDYWLARVDLIAAVGNALPSDSATDRQAIDVRDLIGPRPEDRDESHDHSMHDHSNMTNDSSTEADSMDHSQHDMSKQNSNAAPAAHDDHGGTR